MTNKQIGVWVGSRNTDDSRIARIRQNGKIRTFPLGDLYARFALGAIVTFDTDDAGTLTMLEVGDATTGLR